MTGGEVMGRGSDGGEGLGLVVFVCSRGVL